jgi:hypothetical protein
VEINYKIFIMEKLQDLMENQIVIMMMTCSNISIKKSNKVKLIKRLTYTINKYQNNLNNKIKYMKDNQIIKALKTIFSHKNFHFYIKQ